MGIYPQRLKEDETSAPRACCSDRAYGATPATISGTQAPGRTQRFPSRKPPTFSKLCCGPRAVHNCNLCAPLLTLQLFFCVFKIPVWPAHGAQSRKRTQPLRHTVARACWKWRCGQHTMRNSAEGRYLCAPLLLLKAFEIALWPANSAQV